jgi:Ca2+-binding EF-hand superfamily protein
VLQGGVPEGESQTSRTATKEQQEDPLFVEFKKFDSSNRGYLCQYDVNEMMKSMGKRHWAQLTACHLLHIYTNCMHPVQATRLQRST